MLVTLCLRSRELALLKHVTCQTGIAVLAWSVAAELLSDRSMKDIEKEKVPVDAARSSTILCFLAGFTAGVLAAVLVAPASGIATRSRIGRKFKDCEDWIEDKATEAEDRVRARGEDLLARAREVGEAIARP